MPEPILNLHDVEEFFVLCGLYDFLKGGETVIEDIVGNLPDKTQIFYENRIEDQFFKLVDKGVFEVIGNIGSGSDDTVILLTKAGYNRGLDIYRNNEFIHNAVLSREKNDISRLLPPHHSYEDFLSLRKDSSGDALEPAIGHNSGSVIDFSKYDEEIEDGLARIDKAIEAIRGDNNIDTELKPSIISAIQSGVQHLRDRARALLGAVREPILAGLTKGLEVATTTATVAALTGALTWATAFFAGLI